MENEAFVDQEMDQNGPESDVKPKKSKKQRTKKTYSVKVEQNEVELNALSKALPNLNTSNDDAESSIGAAVRQGRRSVISREIEKAKRNKSLDSLDDVGFAALHHTTRYCRIDAIEDLLKNGASINIQSRDDHFTPLHIATRFGWHEAVDILLKYGADPSLQSKTGQTALHLACRKGCPKTAMLLLKQKGIDIDARDSLLRTPLHTASSYGHYHLIIALLDNGADVFALAADKTSCLYMYMMNNSGSNYTHKAINFIMEKVFQTAPEKCFISNRYEMNGFTFAHIAAATNVIEVMKKAIDRGVDVNVANVLNGMTPIHAACRKGFLEMAELLVRGGADIHIQTLQGQTPLHFAAVGGHDHIIRFLIDKGAQVDARDSKNMTPFLLASSKPKAKPSTLQLFIEAGADANASEAFMKNCLHLAVESENYDLIQFFLGNDDAVNNLFSSDVNERVPLHYAAKSGSLKVLKLLLTKQQFLNLQDEDQKTAIYLAAKGNRLEHVNALGQAGASLNNRDDEGRTALHAAASRQENRKVCKALVSFGADVNCKDNRDKTPLMLAAESGCAKTVKTMLKLNANIDDTTVDGDSALLCAVRTNNSEVVQLLMDRNVKLTHRDLTGAGVFETAVKFDAKEAVNVICRHERYKEVVNNTCSAQGQRPMQILIKHFPEAANVIMSKCICRSTNILPTHEDYKVSYDFELLDPGPDDPDCLAGNRYFGPATMVNNKRQDLLLHPLTQKLLDIKWQSFGSKIYYLSLFLYFWYMTGYSYFVVVERGREFPRNFSTVKISEIYTLSTTNYRIAIMIIAFAAFQLFREVIQIFGQRLRYFKQSGNYMEWVLYSASIFFVLPYVGPSIIYKSIYREVNDVYYMWIIAIISIFLCYANFVLFLRRFTLFGIYITMFIVVFRSLIRVMVVFLEFLIAFAVVFYILLKEQPAFSNLGYATVKTIAMSIGEMDFTSTFIDSIGENNKITGHPLNPFPETAFVFAGIFMSVMCVTLMNLLIGLAIGDIDNVQRSAELQRLSMQVEFVAEIEEKYPRFITRRLYKPIIDVMPNKKTISLRLKKLQASFQGALKDLTSTTGEQTSEREENNVNIMAETLEKNRRQIKALVNAMDAQASLIKSIAEKVDSHFKTISTESLKFGEPLEKNIDEEED